MSGSAARPPPQGQASRVERAATRYRKGKAPLGAYEAYDDDSDSDSDANQAGGRDEDIGDVPISDITKGLPQNRRTAGVVVQTGNAPINLKLGDVQVGRPKQQQGAEEEEESSEYGQFRDCFSHTSRLLKGVQRWTQTDRYHSRRVGEYSLTASLTAETESESEEDVKPRPQFRAPAKPGAGPAAEEVSRQSGRERSNGSKPHRRYCSHDASAGIKRVRDRL